MNSKELYEIAVAEKLAFNSEEGDELVVRELAKRAMEKLAEGEYIACLLDLNMCCNIEHAYKKDGPWMALIRQVLWEVYEKYANKETGNEGR